MGNGRYGEVLAAVGTCLYGLEQACMGLYEQTWGGKGWYGVVQVDKG